MKEVATNNSLFHGEDEGSGRKQSFSIKARAFKPRGRFGKAAGARITLFLQQQKEKREKMLVLLRSINDSSVEKNANYIEFSDTLPLSDGGEVFFSEETGILDEKSTQMTIYDGISGKTSHAGNHLPPSTNNVEKKNFSTKNEPAASTGDLLFSQLGTTSFATSLNEKSTGSVAASMPRTSYAQGSCANFTASTPQKVRDAGGDDALSEKLEEETSVLPCSNNDEYPKNPVAKHFKRVEEQVQAFDSSSRESFHPFDSANFANSNEILRGFAGNTNLPCTHDETIFLAGTPWCVAMDEKLDLRVENLPVEASCGSDAVLKTSIGIDGTQLIDGGPNFGDETPFQSGFRVFDGSGEGLLNQGFDCIVEEDFYKKNLISPDETIKRSFVKKKNFRGRTAGKPKSGRRHDGLAFPNREKWLHTVYDLVQHDWLVDIPADLSENWLFFLRPDGKRCLLTINNHYVVARDKWGIKFKSFTCCIPSKGAIVLEAVYNPASEVFFIVDLLQWNDCILSGSTTECRHFFLTSKFHELSGLASEVSNENHYPLVLLEFFECSPCTLELVYFSNPEYETDSIMFVHKEAIYLPGFNPLWLCWRDSHLSRYNVDTPLEITKRRNKRIVDESDIMPYSMPAQQSVCLILLKNGELRTADDIIVGQVDEEELASFFKFPRNRIIKGEISGVDLGTRTLLDLKVVKHVGPVPRLIPESLNRIVSQNIQRMENPVMTFADILESMSDGVDVDMIGATGQLRD